MAFQKSSSHDDEMELEGAGEGDPLLPRESDPKPDELRKLKHLRRRRHLASDSGTQWRMRLAAESSSRRFMLMLCLSTAYLIAELVFGVLSGSLALLTDAFHMISDVVAISMGWYIAKLSTRERTIEMSFGWARAEVVGAMANGCFLLAVCFTILLEAVEKLAGLGRDNDAELEKNAKSIMIVGTIGVAMNLMGMCIFSGQDGGGHGHSHDMGSSKPKKKAGAGLGGGNGHSHDEGGHGHGHSHGHSHGHAHSDSHDLEAAHGHAHEKDVEAGHTHEHDNHHGHDHSHEAGHSHEEQHGHGHSHEAGHAHEEHHGHGHSHGHAHEGGHAHTWEGGHYNDSRGHGHSHDHDDHHHGHTKWNMNEYSLYLHVMGDALGSAVVVANAYIIKYTDWEYRFLADPIASLIIVVIILLGTVPLVRDAAHILLEASPRKIGEGDEDVVSLKKQIREVPGVLEVHDFHVWKLNPDNVVLATHLIVDKKDMEEVNIIVDAIKVLLHKNNVHSSFIQPETYCEGPAEMQRYASNCADPVCDAEECAEGVMA